MKLSPEGTDGAASVAALSQPFTRFRRCAVIVLLPCDYGADIDNALKATLDLLQEMGVIENDRYVEEITVRRDPSIATLCDVRVTAV